MKNIKKYIIFTYLLTFLFVLNVNAECSYQERKDLLNKAKNIQTFFTVETKEEEFVGINPNTDEEEIILKKYNYFKLNILGITNDLFVKILNNKNNEEIIVNNDELVNGEYYLNVDNTTDIIKYYVFFYSLNDNCFAQKIHQKTINKPKENGVYFYSVCSNKLVSEHEYCKQFVDKEYKKNEYEMVSELNEIIEKEKTQEMNKSTENLRTIIYNYWYYVIIFLLLIIITIIVIRIRKKSYEL